MKIKIRPFGQKKTYYFNHQKGVLQKRGKFAVMRVFASSFMVIILFCGAGVGAKEYYQNYQSSVRLQQSAAQTAPSQAETTDDKLKTAAPQAQEDKALARTISQTLSSLPKGQDWSVYVRDLKSNRMASVSADASYNPAQLSQLFLLPALENKTTADKWLNTRVDKQTIKTCVDRMIRSADDMCTKALTDYVGFNAADQYNQTLGFTKTKLAASSGAVTTAREAGDLMYRLQTSQLLSDKARRILFDSLYGQTKREGVPAGCGVQCLVANKPADDGQMHHDVAVVTDKDAKYIVVIMSKGASWQAVAEVQRSINSAMQP